MSVSVNNINQINSDNSLVINSPNGVVAMNTEAFVLGDLSAALIGVTGPNPGKNVVTSDANGQNLPLSFYGFQEAYQLTALNIKVAAYNVTLDENYVFSFNLDINIGPDITATPTYISPMYNMYTQFQNATTANLTIGSFPGGAFIQANGVVGQEIR